MKSNMSKLLVESVVKKSLKDIKDSPERGIRNLIDMALQFSDGRFQKNFFEATQTMLQNENSAYYGLVRDTVLHVDPDRLQHFGLNLGYNGCTEGARHIRENEKSLGCDIPWAMPVQVNAQQLMTHGQQYHTLFQEGEQLGIYIWMLFAQQEPQTVLPFVKDFPDSAFFLFCCPEDMTPAFLDIAAELRNLMPVVRYDENATDIYAALREMGLLYSVWYPYESRDLAAIINGDLFCSVQQCSPIFAVLLPQRDCPDEIQHLAHLAVLQARTDQNYRMIPWELQGDNSRVDEIISEDVCSVYFDENGDLCGNGIHADYKQLNLFEHRLSDILRIACPKKNRVTETVLCHPEKLF